MLIAIYFSGKASNYSLEKILRIKNRYNCVCFASLNVPCSEEFLKSLEISHERVLFQPIFAPNSLHNQKKTSKDVRVDNVYSMFYHNNKCMELIADYQKRTGILFDCVLKYRSDINNHEDLELEVPSSNTVFIPSGSDWCSGVNDQIAYGNFETMKKYSNVIHYIDKYVNQGIPIHPETLLSWHLMTFMIKIKRFKFVYELQR